jgi:hypothetical protein
MAGPPSASRENGWATLGLSREWLDDVGEEKRISTVFSGSWPGGEVERLRTPDVREEKGGEGGGSDRQEAVLGRWYRCSEKAEG